MTLESTIAPAHSKTWRPFTVLTVLALSTLNFPLSTAHAQYAVDWSTIDGGGSTSTNGQYAISGTIGQLDAGGPMTNGQYSVTGGFWVMPAAVQTPGAPYLSITLNSQLSTINLSWTPTGTNWVLQENLNLATTNWVNSVSGATNPIVVPATSPQKFYRLHKP